MIVINPDIHHEKYKILSSEESLKDNGLKVLWNITEFINKLPFAGKLSITPLVVNAAREQEPLYQLVKTVEASGLLGIMVLGHYNQALMAVDRIQQNVKSIGNDSTLLP